MKRIFIVFFIVATGLFALLLRPFPAAGQGTATPQPSGDFQKLVDVGGYKLFINCLGKGTPTVILDHGLGDNSRTWKTVQPAVAKFTRVCSYDRAGRGKSDPRPGNASVSSGQIDKELHTLLTNAQIDGSFVMVGHSIGGLNMRIYASLYADQTAGAVFVDGTPPEWITVQPAIATDKNPENMDIKASVEEAQKAAAFPDIPLVVLSHTPGMLNTDMMGNGVPQNEDVWVELQAKQAQLSPQGVLIVADHSGHFIQEAQPGLVVNSIQRVVETVRNGKNAPTLTPFWTPMPSSTPGPSPTPIPTSTEESFDFPPTPTYELTATP